MLGVKGSLEQEDQEKRWRPEQDEWETAILGVIWKEIWRPNPVEGSEDLSAKDNTNATHWSLRCLTGASIDPLLLCSSVFNKWRYLTWYQKSKLNTKQASNLFFNGVLIVRYANSNLTEIMWE